MQTQTIANVKAAPTTDAPMPTPTLNLAVSVGDFFFGVQLEVGGAFEPVPVAGGPGGQLSVVVDELEGELEGALVKLVSWVDDDDDDGIVVAV